MNNEYLGKCLLDRGFATWFRYMFRVLEGTPFIIEPLHKDLLETLEDVFNGNKTRLVLNLPPRSGKTTLAKYLVAYSLTTNPKSNIIYTSYSQSLLSDIALSVQNILEHPIYKAMYPSNLRYEEEYTNPIDDFWAEYLKKETGKNLYSSKKIITRYGGIVLFSSIGSQITGFGAGCRNTKKFSGFLCLDDPNKPSDTYSQVMREKVVRYYEETLLSRLNNSNVPIIEIQQRLHLEDLSGVLIKKYNFDVLKKPLLNDNGVCQLPSQYTAERIKELKVNNYSFQAQYMQEPIILGGSVIKREWFGYYNPTLQQTYKRIVISADTAMTVKEKSDYTCLLVGGVTAQNKLHILEMVHAKLEYPELKQAVINLYNKYKEGETKCSAIYIENKASGIQLLQDFKKVGLPVCGIDVTKDKLTRVEEILEYLASGLVLLPESESYGNNPEFLAECEAFSRDMSATHDDIIDSLVHMINNTIANRKVSLLEVL
jgi:predicted phage terminase large subunit-like protein